MWALDVWAVLTSRVQIRRCRRRPKQWQQGVRPPGEDYVGERMRLAGLRAGGTSTSCRANRAAGAVMGGTAKEKQEGLLKEEEGLPAPGRTRRKRPEQHPVE